MARPNVLVVHTDQQRADTLAPQSACRTPACDRLADRGVWFDRCYAPNSVCSPSRASFTTGQLPHTHGMTHVSHSVPDYQARFRATLPTWSERLQSAGYHTGYVGKWHVERESGPSGFGFDTDVSDSIGKNMQEEIRDNGRIQSLIHRCHRFVQWCRSHYSLCRDRCGAKNITT